MGYRILNFIVSLLTIFFLIWATGYGIFLTYSLSLKPSDQTTKTDAIVVLTGGNKRIETGLALYAEGLAPTLFITGVHDLVTKADIVSSWKGKNKLPDCCIVLGHKALTTFDNALEAQEWINKNHITSIRLVTSDYHVARALLEFERSIPKDIKIIVHPVKEEEKPLETARFWVIVFSEYNKILYRLVETLSG